MRLGVFSAQNYFSLCQEFIQNMWIVLWFSNFESTFGWNFIQKRVLGTTLQWWLLSLSLYIFLFHFIRLFLKRIKFFHLWIVPEPQLLKNFKENGHPDYFFSSRIDRIAFSEAILMNSIMYMYVTVKESRKLSFVYWNIQTAFWLFSSVQTHSSFHFRDISWVCLEQLLSEIPCCDWVFIDLKKRTNEWLD